MLLTQPIFGPESGIWTDIYSGNTRMPRRQGRRTKSRINLDRWCDVLIDVIKRQSLSSLVIHYVE